MDKGELIGGPQDGGRVRTGSNEVPLPDTVYVGPRNLGDGYAAWGREPSTRFPAAYRRRAHDPATFGFAGWAEASGEK